MSVPFHTTISATAMKQYRWGVILLLLSGLFACSEDDPTEEIETSKNIVHSLEETGQYSIFLSIIRANGLEATLSADDEQSTLFAPTDQAFTLWLTTLGLENIFDVSPSLLRSTMQYHIVEGDFPPNRLTDALPLNTLLGLPLTITQENSAWQVNEVSFSPNLAIGATNGTIYPIEQVIPLPKSVTDSASFATKTLADWLQETEGYQWMKNAASATSLMALLKDTTQKFTLLACADSPIEFFFQQRGFANLESIPQYIFKNFVRYHVVPDTILQLQELQASAIFPTALGHPIRIIREGNNFFIESPHSGDDVRWNTDPIRTKNGVVYEMTMPLNAPITAQMLLSDEPEFSWLRRSLENTPTWAHLNDLSQEITLLAPTDALLANYLANEGLAETEIFLNTTEATKLAKYHLVQDDLRIGEGQSWKALSTFRTVENDTILLSLLWTESGLLNGAVLPDPEQFTHYYIANGTFALSEVLTPLSVSEVLRLHPETDSLQSVVNALNFQNSLNANRFTLLAPNNEAFQTTLSNATNGIDSLAQVNASLLFYHMLNSYRTPNSFTTGEQVTTFSLGKRLTVSNAGELLFFAENSSARVVGEPFVARNGMVYLIENVLLP